MLNRTEVMKGIKKMSNIVVTGGAGFIGSWIAESLADRGHNVISIDDLSGGDIENVSSNVDFYKVDCSDENQVWDCIYEPVDILVHCAANAREGASQFQPVSVTQRNYAAYVNVLTRCIQKGVKSVVCYSSMAIYGHGTPPFSEDDVLQPVDVYGVNKAAMEKTTDILAKIHNFCYTLIRPHNCFGIRQCMRDDKRNVIAIFMNRIMRKEPLVIYGDGLQKRAFSYIADSLPTFVKICENESPCPIGQGDIVNIGGIEETTILEMANAVKDAMGVPDWPVVHVEDRPCEVKYAWSTYEKSVKKYGYTEVIGWRSGIQAMAEWAKRKGPQEWKDSDVLELGGEKLPVTWKKGFDPSSLLEV